MKTLYVNLFGGPGSGKSTGSAFIFSKLKMLGIDCQLVSEYAKDKCWQENKFMFSCPQNQFYIGAKQFYKLNQVNGKVQMVITDSPLLLNACYNESKYLGENYNDLIFNLFNKFENANYFINRVKKYNPNGRNQDQKQSDDIREKMINLLNKSHIEYMYVNGQQLGYNKILEDVLLKYQQLRKK